jgi:ribosome recycling factor
MLFDKKKIQEELSSNIDALKRRFSGIRTGRALPALLEPVVVDAYGGRSPLSAVANVTSMDARMLAVQVWDAQLISAVAKAIRTLGFQTQEDNATIRVFLPEMSEEQRKKMVKMARDYAEEARISLRNTRRRFVDVLEKEKSAIPEDDLYAAKKEVQKILDDNIAVVNDLAQRKEKEIMA